MFNFLSNNMGTILTGLVLLVIVTAVILNIYWNKRKNNSAGACANCCCCCGRCDFDAAFTAERLIVNSAPGGDLTDERKALGKAIAGLPTK